LVQEAIYGIQARQSVHLTEIARSLEEKIPLIKTENRLSRNLARPQLRTTLQDALVRQGAKRMGRDTLLILDLSDLVKPYAKKMEYLARVRDGSEGKLADGYWLCQVIGVENEGNEITPLYGELYSSQAKDFVSENREILKALRKISRAVGEKGVWVIDRGGDRGRLYEELIPQDLRFIVRQMGDRDLLSGPRRESMLQIAQDCALPYQPIFRSLPSIFPNLLGIRAKSRMESTSGLGKGNAVQKSPLSQGCGFQIMFSTCICVDMTRRWMVRLMDTGPWWSRSGQHEVLARGL
jgi:hypothetical protein